MDQLRDILPDPKRVQNGDLPSTWRQSERTGESSLGLPNRADVNQTPISKGVLLSTVANRPAMDLQDLDHLCAQLTAAYRTSYYNPDSTEFAIAKMLFDMAVEDGYSSDEFRKALTRFLKANRWPTWTPADFFLAERPKVYPYSWVMEQLPADREAIEGYEVPGVPVAMWGFKHEVGDSLKVWNRDAPVPAPGAAVALETPPAPVESIEPETVTLVSLMRIRLELEETVADLRKRLQGETQRAEEHRAEVLRLQGEYATVREELLATESERNRERDRADALQVELDDWTGDDEATSGFPAIGQDTSTAALQARDGAIEAADGSEAGQRGRAA